MKMSKVTHVGREDTTDEEGDISVDGGEHSVVDVYRGDDLRDVDDEESRSEGDRSAVYGGEVSMVDAYHRDITVDIDVQGDDHRGSDVLSH